MQPALRVELTVEGHMSRTIAKCAECGEEREVVSQERCAKCLMRDRRAAQQIAEMENFWSKPKKHEAEKKKAQKKVRNSANGIWNSLDDLEPFVPEHLINMIRAAIKPAMVLSMQALDPDDGEPEDQIVIDREAPTDAAQAMGETRDEVSGPDSAKLTKSENLLTQKDESIGEKVNLPVNEK
jgi:hypothetical protein